MALHPASWFTRKVFNPIAMRLGLSGTKRLAVKRRRTGGTQEVPVIPVEIDGARYLVSPRGETDWVRNLRAAGGQGELSGEPVSCTEVAVEERDPVLDVYKDVTGRATKSHFDALPDPADHPVFLVVLRG